MLGRAPVPGLPLASDPPPLPERSSTSTGAFDERKSPWERRSVELGGDGSGVAAIPVHSPPMWIRAANRAVEMGGSYIPSAGKSDESQ